MSAAPPRADSIRALVERQAAAHPEAVYALATEGGRQLTFGSLARDCAAVQRLLESHGVGRGDTVSLVMPNGLQTLRLLLGGLYGGVCVNPINLLAQPDQMRYVLQHSDCKLVFVAPEWESRVRALIDGIGRGVAVVVTAADAAELPVHADAQHAAGAELAGHADAQRAARAELPAQAGAQQEAGAAPPAPPAPHDLALLMYTSGTTGVPKGVMLSQANLAANAQAVAEEHALTAADRVLAVLPLYHINAFAVTMLAPLASGSSLAMPPRFSAARFWAQAADAHCTWLNVVPTMISYLLEGADPDPAQTRGIRFCRSASAALPPEHLQAFERRFGIGVIETMGLTETVAPAFSNPLDPARRKLGSVGAASGCEASVVDAELQPVADGVTGEVVIRGPNVMLGYYKNETATQASLTADGWLRTGDLGHRDGDGFFFITGRIKELIIKGGENIAPREIDEVLLAHPAVLEAAAVGIPDRHYGQEIMACVVLRDRTGEADAEAELRRFCVERLGAYKTPKVFRFVAELPRGPSGKVQRLKLLET